MSYRVKLLTSAKEDIRNSIDWYNIQKPGLGGVFYSHIKSKIDLIGKNPLIYQIKYRDIRNAPISQFPFQIHFRVLEADSIIVIFGVTHMRRDPQIWKNHK